KYKEDDAEFVAQLKTGAEGRKAADHSANEAEAAKALGQSETGAGAAEALGQSETGAEGRKAANHSANEAEAAKALGQSEPGAEATKAADQSINDAVVSEASDQSEQSGSFTDRLAAAGFNIEEAHSFTMEDDEFYMELLETYISGAEEKRNNIKKFYDEENWKDYQIAVHGLKSSSRTLGADQLADLAYAQELAAKALQDGSGTEDAIRGGIEELLRVYNDTVEVIQQAIHS
ncbi:MAG: Hpt domain-containing protein, partial [Eubacterium sp.]|nr:Hpt domain-containing protein [Eubacterium sp.]